MGNLSDKMGSLQYIPTPQSPDSAGFIQAFAGSAAPSGWALCDGAVLEQADYPDLYGVLGSTWDAFVHPVDGSPVVGGSQFAIPNLKGLYLSMAGDAGGDSRTLGVYQNDATSQNGLTVSGGTASGTFASSSHTHNYDGKGTKSFTAGNGLQYTNGGSVLQLGQTFLTASPNATSSVSNTPASISASDSETRPKTAPVNYIIKLYSDKTNAISVGVNPATATDPGVVKANRWQRSQLTSDIPQGTLGVVNELSFSGLEIGKIYRYSASVHINDGTISSAANIQAKILHDGNIVDYVLTAINDATNDFTSPKFTGIFKASATDVTFELTSLANCSIDANNGGDTTYAQLEELNNYEDESSAFTYTP